MLHLRGAKHLIVMAYGALAVLPIGTYYLLGILFTCTDAEEFFLNLEHGGK